MLDNQLAIEAKLSELKMNLKRLLKFMESSEIRELKPSEIVILRQLEKGH